MCHPNHPESGSTAAGCRCTPMHTFGNTATAIALPYCKCFLLNQALYAHSGQSQFKSASKVKFKNLFKIAKCNVFLPISGIGNLLFICQEVIKARFYGHVDQVHPLTSSKCLLPGKAKASVIRQPTPPPVSLQFTYGLHLLTQNQKKKQNSGPKRLKILFTTGYIYKFMLI